MNLLGRPKHLQAPRILTRTSPTPQPTPHATPTTSAAPFSSGRQTPYELRPTSSPPRGVHIRYRTTTTTPLLPNTTSTNSIFASSSSSFPFLSLSLSLPLRFLPLKATSQMSSASTPASTQPFASSTPPGAPPAGSNHNTDADASHAHPFGRPRGGDDLDPGNSNSNDKDSSMGNSTQNNHQDPASSGGNNKDNDNVGGSLLPALPAPDATSPDGPTPTTTTTLEVDGKAVVLDHLGPMVIGRDGTVSRISNWQELSERERQNTLRVLGKRNQVRLAALRGQQEEEGNKAA